MYLIIELFLSFRESDAAVNGFAAWGVGSADGIQGHVTMGLLQTGGVRACKEAFLTGVARYALALTFPLC